MSEDKKKPGRPKGKNAAYRKLASVLAARLESGEWTQGQTLPTYRQLAEEYDVGMQVVRLAIQSLRNDKVITTNLRQQTLARGKSEEGDRHPNLTALILGHNLLNQSESSGFGALQQGIQRGLGEKRAPLLIAHDRWRLRNTIPPDLLDLPLRGILLQGNFQKEVIKGYTRMNIPVVQVDRPPSSDQISSVSLDNERAAFDATERLIQMGHRRIAFMRFIQLNLRDIDADSKEREQGFRKAMAKNDLPLPSGAILNSFNNDRSGGPTIQALFNSTPRYTAVVTVDGGRASIVEQGASDRGLTIPNDLSVVTFSAKSFKARWSGPQADFVELGYQAAKLVLKSNLQPSHIKISTTWNQGETIAPLIGTSNTK